MAVPTGLFIPYHTVFYSARRTQGSGQPSFVVIYQRVCAVVLGGMQAIHTPHWQPRSTNSPRLPWRVDTDKWRNTQTWTTIQLDRTSIISWLAWHILPNCVNFCSHSCPGKQKAPKRSAADLWRLIWRRGTQLKNFESQAIGTPVLAVSPPQATVL